ncbi:sialate:O-sulfotransferase 1-like [Oratosquilla oratoria]|uniref:sialate:O-sulfotransferase 1-like n=1 Tax=Oratosquilla oratoria TaxID=337810 RepID=UPI003F769C42
MFLLFVMKNKSQYLFQLSPSSTPHLTSQQEPQRQVLNREDPEGIEQGVRQLRPLRSSRSKILWPEDPNCNKYDIDFGNDLPHTVLLSYPRSGNTWTRYLIEAATGIYTGSVYHNGMLYRTGFLGEKESWNDRTTIVKKTHIPFHVTSSDSVIMIIRNPARACISLFNYKSSKADDIMKFKDTVPEPQFSSESERAHSPPLQSKGLPNLNLPELERLNLRSFSTEFHLHANGCPVWWREVASAGLRARRLLPIYYEYLREDPIPKLLLILRFLGMEPDEGRLSCLKKHLDGEYKGNQLTIDPYTPEEKLAFDNAINFVNTSLQKRGFDRLPDYSLYRN